MTITNENITCFSQKPLAHFQPNFECKLVGTMKIHQHNAGHMTKMAAMPVYGKNTLTISFSGTTGLILMKLCLKHQRPKPFINKM